MDCFMTLGEIIFMLLEVDNDMVVKDVSVFPFKDAALTVGWKDLPASAGDMWDVSSISVSEDTSEEGMVT